MYLGTSPHDKRTIPPSAGAHDADRRRAATQTSPSATAILADAGPLVLDLPTAPIGSHFALDSISAIGIATINAPGDSPLTGLYLVRENAPGESLAQTNTGDGVNMIARDGVHLASDWAVVPIGAAKFAYSVRARLAGALIVPHGYVVRLMLNILPGTAAPGPGINSTASLKAQGSIEPD